MSDNRTTDLLYGLRDVGNLHEFAELFGFDWRDDSDWTWHDVAVKMADDFEQAIAATLGRGECEAIHDKGYYKGIHGYCEGLRCSNCGEPLFSEFGFCPWCSARIRKAVEQ